MAKKGRRRNRRKLRELWPNRRKAANPLLEVSPPIFEAMENRILHPSLLHTDQERMTSACAPVR